MAARSDTGFLQIEREVRLAVEKIANCVRFSQPRSPDTVSREALIVTGGAALAAYVYAGIYDFMG